MNATSSEEMKGEINRRIGTFPHIPMKPQGWEDAKSAKNGHFKCYWGCEKVLRSRKEAGEHRCRARRNTFQDMITMCNLKQKEPLLEYFLEAEGGRQDNFNHGTTSDSSSSSASEVSEYKKNLGFSMEDLKKALPKYKKMDRVNDWLLN